MNLQQTGRKIATKQSVPQLYAYFIAQTVF